MKNAKMSWKDYRQPGIPSSGNWGTREWRRFEERQNRKTRQQAQAEAEDVMTAGCLLSLGKLAVLCFLGYFALFQSNKWATLAIAAWAVFRSFGVRVEVKTK